MSHRHTMLLVVSLLSLAGTGCLGLLTPHTAGTRRWHAAAPPPQTASQSAASTLATVQAARFPGWEPAVTAATGELATFSTMQIPTVAGRCYDVLVAIDAGSAWPSRTAPLEVRVDRTSRQLMAFALPRGNVDEIGPFDGLHPYANSNVFCVERDGEAQLTPTARGPTAAAAPTRGQVLVLSRDLLDIAATRETPASWPAEFLLLPGRIESDSSGGNGGLQIHAIRVQATITSPELADLFYQRVAERAGLRLTQHSENRQPDGPTAYTRTYSGHGQTWNIYFFRAVTNGGSLGTVTALQTVTSGGSARAER